VLAATSSKQADCWQSLTLIAIPEQKKLKAVALGMTNAGCQPMWVPALEPGQSILDEV